MPIKSYNTSLLSDVLQLRFYKVQHAVFIVIGWNWWKGNIWTRKKNRHYCCVIKLYSSGQEPAIFSLFQHLPSRFNKYRKYWTACYGRPICLLVGIPQAWRKQSARSSWNFSPGLQKYLHSKAAHVFARLGPLLHACLIVANLITDNLSNSPRASVHKKLLAEYENLAC